MKLSAASIERVRNMPQPASPPSSQPPASEDDLGEVKDDALIKELSRRYREGQIDETDFRGTALAELGGDTIEDADAFTDAFHWWQRGDKREALHYLELALGRDFTGLGDLKPEDLR